MRMLLADSSDTFRLGVRAALDKSGTRIMIEEVRDRAELMTNLRSRDYELLMLDPSFTGGTGEGLIKQICAISPKSNILVFTAMDDLAFGVRVIKSGARGYLMKTCSAEELETAVTRVGQGKVHICSALSAEIVNHLFKREPDALHDRLTERELQVFSMLVCGNKITEAANMLNLSVKTVSTHKVRLMDKLKISNLSEMIQYAVSQGLMEGCRTRCASFCTA